VASAGEGALGPSASEGALEPAARLPSTGEHESPEARRERGILALDVGARLLAGATTFFFLSFLFAYFYLRSLNVENLWRPHHVKPDQAMGAAFVACVIVSVALALLASRAQQRGSRGWGSLGWVAVLLGLAAVALQCITYTVQKFGPTDDAYASVYVAWTAFYLLFVLGSMYWLETQLATDLRERREPTAKGGEGVTTYEHPDRLLPRGMSAAVFYWAYLGALGVIMYVVLYLL
jgi:heme/copper-type cytochrome/quinol oxidase subunit 3